MAFAVGIAGWIVSAVAILSGAADPNGGMPALITVPLALLVAALSGGAVSGIMQRRTERNRERREDAMAPAEIERAISEAANNAAAAATAMLQEYRQDLQESKREIMRLTERVAALEAELKVANGQRAQLQQELNEAIARRIRAMDHIKALERRIDLLEETSQRRGELSRIVPVNPPRKPPSSG